jgi:prepilin-type N-terminal cleavage/methylation domain-containing protein
MRKTKALTLIELLIVAAVVAVLAAIAVANVQEARIRSQASRVKSNQRAMSVALESFYADHKWYPPDGFPWNSGITCPWIQTELVPTWFASMNAAYNSENEPTGWWKGSMIWMNYQDRNKYYQHSGWPQPIERVPNVDGIRYPQWEITSIGPDLSKDNTTSTNPAQAHPEIIYDPTNGTVSIGNIFRDR